MIRAADLLACAGARLRAAGIAGAPSEARLLLAAAAGVPAMRLFAEPELAVDERAGARFRVLVERRAGRAPLSQILGRREFWSLDFLVTPDTLTPRPDSETVVAAALDSVADRETPLCVVDLGTGTGCLLLSLLSELPRATGVGVDLSPAACTVARRNALALGLADRAHVVCGDWARAVRDSVDLVVVNPPYIATRELDRLMPEVRDHEPRLALDGGHDGLGAYRLVAPALPALLGQAGRCVLEIGAEQEEGVTGVLTPAGLRVVATKRDLAGRPRCLVVAGGSSAYP